MNFTNKDKILIVAAHPDDETLGCGGVIDKAIKNGANIHVIFLGEGVSSRFEIGKENSKESILAKKIRETESKKALKILNVKNYKFGNRHCNKFDKYPLSNLVTEVEANIDKFNPNIIFTHNDRDVNIDHGIVYKAVMNATRPNKKINIKFIFSFEVPCSSNWIYGDKFNPNVFMDISKNIKTKQKAFSAYKNENKNFPFPRSKIGIDTLAKFRGMQSGLKCAEAFRLERGILV